MRPSTSRTHSPAASWTSTQPPSPTSVACCSSHPATAGRTGVHEDQVVPSSPTHRSRQAPPTRWARAIGRLSSNSLAMTTLRTRSGIVSLISTSGSEAARDARAAGETSTATAGVRTSSSRGRSSEPDPAPTSTTWNGSPILARSVATNRARVRPNSGLTSGEVRKSPAFSERSFDPPKKPSG